MITLEDEILLLLKLDALTAQEILDALNFPDEKYARETIIEMIFSGVLYQTSDGKLKVI